MIFDRTQKLLGQNNLQKLANSNIIIFGIGGVGGYVAEMLARCGVGHLTLVDFDKVTDTNINRQIIALHSTIGRYKVDVMKERISDINPDCIVQTVASKVDATNVGQLLSKAYDYAIDAIDSAVDKADLIECASKSGLSIISALGAGNRYRRPEFKVCDIYKTTNDGLAKKMRKLLRDRGVETLKVVYTDETPNKTEQVTSIVYYPAMCGCLISSEVVNDLITKK